MARTKISELDNSAGNNTDVNGVSTAEGMSPASLNNALREIMAMMSRFNNGVDELTSPDIDGGTISSASISGATIASSTISSLSSDLAVADGGTGASDAAGARSSLSAAASGANSDITSLSGLTTALSIAQGGTGATSASAARTSLGLGSLSTASTISNDSWSGTDLSIANGGTGSSTASAARQSLGLEIGVDVQAYDADLIALGGLATTDGNFIVGNGSAWVTENGATARASLGLGSLATASTISNDSWSGTDLSIANGGTGASDATSARNNLGLGSLATASTVDNSNWSGTPLSVANGGTGQSTQLVPAGILVPYAGSSAPSGWLLCTGAAISRTTYSALFAAIGTAYGSGNGSTTFNLPDLRGRVPAGLDSMGGSAANRLSGAPEGSINGSALGNAGGREGESLTTAQMPSHTHSVVTSWPLGGDSDQDTGNTGYYMFKTTDADGAATYTTTNYNGSNIIGATGSGSQHNNIQPTLITNYIIKT